MRKRIGQAFALALACTFAFNVGARATVQGSPRIIAHVRCVHPAEDTLAHVSLVRLSHTGDTYRVVYRCDSAGY